MTLSAWMDRIRTREARVGIIGLGYVGLPLTLLFSGEGFRVTGFDVDTKEDQHAQQRAELYLAHRSGTYRSSAGEGF